LPPTFTCIRLPVNATALLARADEVIEQNAICCTEYVAYWHKADTQHVRSLSAFGGKADIAKQVARMSEAKSGRSRPNASPGMAGVRHPERGHVVPSPECSDR
jgi:hypothetical protein